MKRLAPIILVMLLLYSNIGFSIVTHYCGDMAVLSEVSIDHKHLNCGMIESISLKEYKQCSKDGSLICSSTCCKNELQCSQNTDEYKSVKKYNLDYSHALVISMALRFNDSIEGNRLEIIEPKFIPPLLKQKSIIMFQSFLI